MKFLKTFLASILGTIVGLGLLFLILFAILMSSASEPEPYVRSNSILTFEMSGDIPARLMQDPFEELLDPGAGAKVSLQSLKSNLEKAASDDNIEGVWIKTNQIGASWANLESAYNYLDKYKESGKFLYFSTDDIGMNEKAYFLASLADSVFSPPETGFEFSGFAAQISFYRGTLEKIGIEPEIFRVGKYKSAVEPFIQYESSPESEEQIREILNTASGRFVQAIERRTGRSAEEVNEMLNSPPVDRLQYALDNGLVDQIAYPDEVENIIKDRIGIEEDDDLETINFGRYSRVSGSSAGLPAIDSDDKIAVLYASGPIIPEIAQSPFNTQPVITAGAIKEQLDKVLEDDNIKAIVLHVNSGGGAATTSDLIWHYVREAADKKPVIASMGGAAASGGYYIAAGADSIVAAENTITGSIGIFNLLFNSQELYNDKLGITFDTFTTHEYADLYDLTRPLTSDEERIIQENVENGYERFVNVVAESRGMSFDEVHEVAQGRVWTGNAAQDVGLVDEIGGLERAIEIAAEMAEVEDYELDSYPKKKDLFEALVGSTNAKVQAWVSGLIPEPVSSNEVLNVLQLMNEPKGNNWALLPIRIDVN